MSGDVPAVSSIYSMTGYARVTSRASDGPSLTLTLKSINHRFLDLQLRLPAGAEGMEAAMRAELKRELARGHVECTLMLDRVLRQKDVDRPAPRFDMSALREYVTGFRAAALELGLATEPDLNRAALVPGLLLLNGGTREGDTADERAAGEAALSREVPLLLAEGLAALKAMRAREGAALAALLGVSLHHLAALVAEVAGLRGEAQEAYRQRLSVKLQALLGGAFDRDRVLTEAALLAERGDVEEELQRMQTHIEHFRALLDGGGEVGKKLDFLLQEMNREANTLLSKTSGTTGGAARITEGGLLMKAEIEKLREQVQNLE